MEFPVAGPEYPAPRRSSEGQIDYKGCVWSLARLGGCFLILTVVKFIAIALAAMLYYVF